MTDSPPPSSASELPPPSPAEPAANLDPETPPPTAPEPIPAGRSILSIASIVAGATLLSKVAGLVRQQVIAAAFGAGPVVDAFAYAYVLPGFLLILLGGINGPFHSAMVSVLAKRDRSEAAVIVETVTTVVCGALLVVSAALVVFAEPAIGLLAPGLSVHNTAAAIQTRELAVLQLQVMAPIAFLAGAIGIGFGTLNAADLYWLPSISPVLSSIVTIGAIGWFAWQQGGSGPDTLALGGVLLAASTTAGALLQWLVQLPAQLKAGMGRFRLGWSLRHPGVQAVLGVMGPAALSSGMLQINLYTDLFFASFVPQAAAALNYANLLIQTPLGLVSNVVLVPLLPVLARSADDRPVFIDRLRQGLLVSAIAMLPLSGLTIALADPIVQVIYERGAFNSNDSQLVASVLMAAGIGMFVYLGRDVMVRAFYALGDANAPFRISLVNIGFNALLDWWLVPRFGAAGIVLATVGVNALAMAALLWLLDRRMGGLPWGDWAKPFGGVLLGSVLAGGVAWGVRWGLAGSLGSSLLEQLLLLVLAGSAGLGVFGAVAWQLRLPELQILLRRWRRSE